MKISITSSQIFSAVTLSCFFFLPAIALSENGAGGNAADNTREQRNFSTSGKASASYQKQERMLPGENVVTPSGQKMKVWTTQGPVPVSPAPEPFNRPNGQVNPNVGVILDGRPNQNSSAVAAPGASQGRTTGQADSFDINSNGSR